MTQSERRRTVVINATCIGKRLDGIGVYALSLVAELVRIGTRHRFVLVLNRNAEEHVRGLSFPSTVTLRWAPSAISPDHGFPGHLLRLLYANILSLRFRGCTVLTASPLEAMFFRRQQVITVHDTIPLVFKRYHRKQYWYYRYVLGRILRRVQRVIVPSEHTSHQVQECYGLSSARIAVIPSGIREVFRSAESTNGKRDKVILLTGRSAPTKNIRMAIEAFNLIKGRVVHDLVIAGHVAQEPCFGVQNGRVKFAGYLADAELRDLYARADLFIFPTLAEGFGFPPLEAMACGCPVVTSRRGSLPEVCGDAVHYVDPSDARDIADGMYRVLTDDTLRRELVAKGRERARKYRWTQTARETLAILDKAAMESSNGRASSKVPR